MPFSDKQKQLDAMREINRNARIRKDVIEDQVLNLSRSIDKETSKNLRVAKALYISESLRQLQDELLKKVILPLITEPGQAAKILELWTETMKAAEKQMSYIWNEQIKAQEIQLKISSNLIAQEAAEFLKVFKK